MEIGVFTFKMNVDKHRIGDEQLYLSSGKETFLFGGCSNSLLQGIRSLCQVNKGKSPELFLRKSRFDYRKISNQFLKYGTRRSEVTI